MASRNFITAQAGVTAIEYALMAGVVGIAAALGANQLGLALTLNFQLIVDALHSLK
jgi:Flp pilus assembly pilin Flp